MAAANAQIGVAVSAYYPDITLTAAFGVASTAFGNLFTGPSSLWSFGPAAAETLFDAGAREAAVEAARASYDQTIANYRQTTLTAFQQVEDNLASLRILADQAKVENTAVALAHHAEDLTLNQFKEGIVAYTAVLLAQTTTLSTEQTALSVQASRLTASVGLIQALGGGWNYNPLNTN
jgi:outer membrane protein TolC